MNSEKIRETNNKFREKILSKEIKEGELQTLAVWLNEVNNFLITSLYKRGGFSK